MPTAVERLTAYLTRALSLQVVEGEATQQLFASLDTQIDTAVAALSTAPTAKAFAAAEATYGHIFKTFGSDGLHFDQEFVRIASVFGEVDHWLGGSPFAKTGAQADFLALDREIFAAGHDLGAFGDSMNTLGSLRSQAQLPGAVAGAAKATGALEADFAALSKETAALVGDLPAGAVATALTPLVAEFAALSGDFGNFTSLLGGNSAPPAANHGATAAANPLTFDGVFASLDADFIALDKSLQGLAAPIADLLIHPSSKSPF